MIARDALVLSEVSIGNTPTRWRFLERNRLIAALAAHTVVAEARWRSGALNTAHHALEIGRQVWAVPGQIDAPNSVGCNRLIRDAHAQILTEAQDLLEAGAGFDAEREDAARMLASSIRQILSLRHRTGCGIRWRSPPTVLWTILRCGLGWTPARSCCSWGHSTVWVLLRVMGRGGGRYALKPLHNLPLVRGGYNGESNGVSRFSPFIPHHWGRCVSEKKQGPAPSRLNHEGRIWAVTRNHQPARRTSGQHHLASDHQAPSSPAPNSRCCARFAGAGCIRPHP